MLNIYLNSTTRTLLISSTCVLALGCQTAYYKAMEKFGYQKRDILSYRVEKVRDAQTEAKQQFKSALEQFSSVVNFNGGDLEVLYNKLDGEYQDSKDKAEKVHSRISDVESVAGALFSEWKEEIGEYHDASLRRKSEQQLAQTKVKYEKLLEAMKRAESKMEPVLGTFHDQVLYLKHNLDARAIASLQSDLSTIEANVNQLIKEMESAINEANTFIKTLN
ncbi:hypothetical conserved protein [Candidatus Nitrosoglobus terrae]|uniref:Hypothetical conserved protein n=1 Tax=Candidatus Nitrosoglobus terrae TaxID=1630141 RepID=A0A1Q2SNC6_9GAMM|nr:DUF2959 domain-containing protein [Candidatus Nitrosoglobus terrae]BAW80634.1 hypothetical conserved protein [Candidatus Nitrosoglobus terrae]